jgi:hypothetical protein
MVEISDQPRFINLTYNKKSELVELHETVLYAVQGVRGGFFLGGFN